MMGGKKGPLESCCSFPLWREASLIQHEENLGLGPTWSLALLLGVLKPFRPVEKTSDNCDSQGIQRGALGTALQHKSCSRCTGGMQAFLQAAGSAAGHPTLPGWLQCCKGAAFAQHPRQQQTQGHWRQVEGESSIFQSCCVQEKAKM